jgi:uncharacterized membrane protein YuzA (DUF378 family)
MKLSILDLIALILVVVGGLNWGLVALGYNLVTGIFGAWPMLVTVVYALVGLSAVYVAVILMKLEKK